MKIQKSLFLFALVAVCSPAMASFELMYIPSISQSRIIRYDPVNRIFLGGMNAPSVRRVMAGNSELGVAHMAPGSYRFNMYGGNPAGYMGTALALGSYNRFGFIVQPNSAGFNLVNIATGGSTNQSLTGPLGLGLGAQLFTAQPGFARFASEAGGLRASAYASSGVLSNSLLTSAGAISSASNVILWTNRFNVEVASMAYFDSTANRFRLSHVLLNTASVFSFGSTDLAIGAFDTTQPVSLAPAHNGFYVVGADGANPTTLTRIAQYDDDGVGFLYDNWTIGLNVSGTPNFGVGMVVAPEPGTMAALGLGALALLRRRRRKA